MLQTKKGIWKSGNLFQDEDGNDIIVYPWSSILDKVWGRFPVECYLLLEDDIVKEFVEIHSEEVDLG